MPSPLTIIVHDPTGTLQLGAVATRFDAHAFHRIQDAIAAINHLNPAAVVLALDEGAIDACERISARQPGLPIILLGNDPGIGCHAVVDVMRAGARDIVDTTTENWQQALSRRIEAGLAWRQSLARGQEVQVAALRAIAERSQGDQVSLQTEIAVLQDQLEAERAVVAQTQSRLEIQRGLALSAVRAKAAFLSNISHEFNTPLSSIIGYCELLADELEGEAAADIERIRTTARLLANLVQTVLNLARLESGDIHPVFETVAVNELLARTVGRLMQKARENKVDLVIEPFELDTVVTDPLRLQEALTHVLENALRFSSGGTVTVRVTQQTDETVFVVADDGVGMDPALLERVFDPFSSADNGEARTGGGAGLSLAIANQLARVLGGRMEASSERGKGSRFAIAIPDANAGATSSGIDRELTVMIVDDDPVLRKVLERMLVADGHAALATGRPEEAVDLAREHKPSLIALDVVLPGTDGWTLLQELTQDPEIRHIPVVIISSTDQSERALEEGARAFLDKPIDRAALREVIRAHAPQPHRVLVLADELPSWLGGLESNEVAFRPCRVAELADAIPTRGATVLFPQDLDAASGVHALRELNGRVDVRCIAVGEFDDAERTFLASRFASVLAQSEVGAYLRDPTNR